MVALKCVSGQSVCMSIMLIIRAALSPSYRDHTSHEVYAPVLVTGVRAF